MASARQDAELRMQYWSLFALEGKAVVISPTLSAIQGTQKNRESLLGWGRQARTLSRKATGLLAVAMHELSGHSETSAWTTYLRSTSFERRPFFRETTSERMAWLGATAFSSGVNVLMTNVRLGPAEWGIQQKLSALRSSNPVEANGRLYSSSVGK